MLSLITSASELTFSSRTLLSGFGCDCLRGLLAPGLRAARLAAGFLHPLLRFLWHRRGGGNIRIWIFQIGLELGDRFRAEPGFLSDGLVTAPRLLFEDLLRNLFLFPRGSG